jgi:hypothetical protein
MNLELHLSEPEEPCQFDMDLLDLLSHSFESFSNDSLLLLIEIEELFVGN